MLSEALSAEATPEDYPLICEFQAFIRRPEPLAAGVRARLFAANGPDADALLTLARTQYQDALVDVQIFYVRQEIGGFQAYVRRPKPSASGMLALFQADNGPQADAIAAMSLSRFLDLDVQCRVRLVQSAEGEDQSRTRAPKGPYSREAQDLWKSGFFSCTQVVAAVGGALEFREWMAAGSCVANARQHGEHEGELVFADLSAVPFCRKHLETIPKLADWALWRKRTAAHMCHQWAWQKWVADHGYSSMTHVPPAELYRWAQRHEAERYLPLVYRLPQFGRVGA